MNRQQHLSLPTLFLSLALLFQLTASLDFVLNGFNFSDVLLYGNATVASRVLTLTNRTAFSIGRALYSARIPTKDPFTSYVYPFSTSFIFAMAPYRGVLPGHGMVFIFAPATGIDGAASTQNLGFLNRTLDGDSDNHLFGVEFDIFRNEEFADNDDNHVGIDVNSLTSISSHTAGYWPPEGTSLSFRTLKLNNGKNYQAWIDYSGSVLNVTIAPAGSRRPARALISIPLDLSEVFLDEMYVGFTAATGQLVEAHKILAWSFSNTNFSLSESLVTTGLPSFVLPASSVIRSKGFIAGTSAAALVVICLGAFLYLFLRNRRQRRAMEETEGLEDWEVEYWPHRIKYEEILAATNRFSEENVIGIGGNGKVYKGILAGGGVEIAVKRFLQEDSGDGLRAFLAEISTLGRLRHRNLVALRGWCKAGGGGRFMLVYDYMENGSLDKRVFECDDEDKLLGFGDRIRILKDVADGVFYLHEGWEAKVVHRDIKASNVLLDKDMCGRLGDFGLARMHDHAATPGTTRVVGTLGYLAPEVTRTGRATTRTDVFGFGVLVLEVMCGRRPIEEGRPALTDWVKELAAQEDLADALDSRVMYRGGFDPEEAVLMLQLGLVCVHPDPGRRPTMRQVVKLMERKGEGGSGTETEEMEAYLLEATGSGCGSLSVHGQGGAHPTLDEVKQSMSSSMSLSWSNSIADGR
ncbi:hypothetical protein SAY86_030261 [Trapa natans]|uniref:non-specific serine/threonine protein kinase n=1 Tax=Trapa natans TaxID=22666 RepID=A0AAN7ML21_TRANT|nr:hypothetical protein SAY86_030261 [Trapa natans]